MRRAVIFILIALSLAGCSDKYKTKEELFKEGIKIMNANNPSGAIVAFKRALEKDQNFFEARFQLAKAYREVGKLDSAENELQKVVRQDPASKDVHVELGKIYLQTGRPDDALKETAGYINDPSGNPEAVEVAAWAYAMKGGYDASIRLLKAIAPDSAHGAAAATALASVYEKMGRLDDAKAQVQEVLKKSPSDRKALGVLGDIQVKENDKDGAINTYDRLIKADPANVNAYSRKALLFIDKGDYDKALPQADKIIEKFPKRPEGYFVKGLILFYGKRFADAAAQLEKSASIAPSPSTYYYLGLCRYYKGEPEQAITELQRAKGPNGLFPEAGILASVIMLQKNRADDAIREITGVLNKDANNAYAHDVLGSAYIAKGMYAEGMAEIDKAIEINPRAVNFYMQKGILEVKAGKAGEAEKALATAVKVNPEVLQPRVTLGSYYLRRHEYQKAVNILQQGIRGQKADAVLYDLIAEALLRQNKAAEAIKYLEKAKASDPADGLAYFKTASLYLRNGGQDRAVAELNAFIGKAPDNPKAYQAIAGIYESRGDERYALYYYQKAMATGRLQGYTELARYYLRKNKTGEALQVLDESDRRYPSDEVSCELRGAAFMMRKNYGDAIKAFEMVEREKPDAGLALIVNAYVTMGKPEKAIDKINEALGQDPENIGLMAAKARIYAQMGRNQDAIQTARNIIAQKAGSPVGYATLAGIYQASKDPDKAAEVLKGQSQCKDLSLVMMLGNIYESKKDYAAALGQYNKAERMQPGNVPSMFRRACVLQSMNRDREARAAYQRVLKISQDHVQSLNNLAYLCAEDNVNVAEALRLAARAVALAPNNGSIEDTLGYVLLKNRKIDEGIKTLKKAAGLMPGNPAVYYHLALGYKEQGNKAQAAENLRKALSLGDFPDAANARAMLKRL